MDAKQIRLECLRLAVGQGKMPSAVIPHAKELEHYVNTGQAVGEPPAAPDDSRERPDARPAKKASKAPARSGKASGQTAKGNQPGPKSSGE